MLLESAAGAYTVWLMNRATISATKSLGAGPAGAIFAEASTAILTATGFPDILFENPQLGQYSAWILNAAGASFPQTS